MTILHINTEIIDGQSVWRLLTIKPKQKPYDFFIDGHIYQRFHKVVIFLQYRFSRGQREFTMDVCVKRPGFDFSENLIAC